MNVTAAPPGTIAGTSLALLGMGLVVLYAGRA
jgi:hypothetical protein